MFRSRASELPPCPQRPSWQQMEEDLTNATKSDIVFTLAKMNTDTPRSQKERRPSANDFKGEEDSNDVTDEEMLECAVEFVERNDNLLSSTKLLAEETEKLQEVSESLRETVEEVKKQALVAIDGC